MAKMEKKIDDGHKFSEYAKSVPTVNVRTIAQDSAIPASVAKVNTSQVAKTQASPISGQQQATIINNFTTINITQPQSNARKNNNNL